MSKVFMRISFALGGLLCPERQCCQETEISAEKHIVKKAEKSTEFLTDLSKKSKKGAKFFKG
jgi:hypothetical protein